jgi:hypothetical protein
MKGRISLKKIIIVHIFLFVFGIIFLEYSKLFRLNTEFHWVYSTGYLWYLLFTLPLCLCGSFILAIYILSRVKENKFLYFISSIVPAIILLTMMYLTF